MEKWDLHSPGPWASSNKARRRAWIVQTYRWLSHFGYDVHIADTLPSTGILVFIPEEESYIALTEQLEKKHRSLTFVGVRADVCEYKIPLADFEIVQNGRFADERRSYFVPHWPQPGIIPRDPKRGSKIENITFKGGFGSLDAEFRTARWNAYLESRKLTFEIASKHTQGEIPRWHDYELADLVLAVRPLYGDGGLRCEKPASKLVNAWHAGVPAILGPEYAFRELQTNDLDYIEVKNAEDAMGAINELIDSPARYRAMIDHGRQRARQFTPQRIAERWAEVLLVRIPDAMSAHEKKFRSASPWLLRKTYNVAVSPPSPFEFRKIFGEAYRHMKKRVVK